MTPLIVLGVAPLVIWLGLILAHGRFWTASERDDRDPPSAPASWPSVVAVVPARDEADVIAGSIGSLLAQDYPGEFRVILVDDSSSDGTADVARAEAERLGRAERLQVLTGEPLPAGWTGKLWAVHQGALKAEEAAPKYLWLTDADIGHAPDNLRSLVSRAEAKKLVLTSLMAELHCRTLPERFLIPAFVFFFQMVYPGAPVVYYGDELGMAGAKDPDNRRAMTWDKVNGNPMLGFVQKMIQVRKAHPALRGSEFRTLMRHNDFRQFVFVRELRACLDGKGHGIGVGIVLQQLGQLIQHATDFVWGGDIHLQKLTDVAVRANLTLRRGISVRPPGVRG